MNREGYNRLWKETWGDLQRLGPVHRHQRADCRLPMSRMPQAVVQHCRGAALGKRSPRRLERIERNRPLRGLELFPWGLLWLNPLFLAVRVAASMAKTGCGT